MQTGEKVILQVHPSGFIYTNMKRVTASWLFLVKTLVIKGELVLMVMVNIQLLVWQLKTKVCLQKPCQCLCIFIKYWEVSKETR